MRESFPSMHDVCTYEMEVMASSCHDSSDR